MTGSISDYGYTTHAPRIRTSVGGLGTAAIVLLVLDAVMASLSVGFLAWRHSQISRVLSDSAAVDPDQLRRTDLAERGCVGWFFIFTLATAAVFICWFWVARSNAEAYSPNHGTLGVGWSVGGWFVPVAALVLPCIVARDIHRGTMAGGRKGGGQVTGWWWAMYVLFWITGFVALIEVGRANNAVIREDRLNDLASATVAGMVTLGIAAVAAVLAIVYVRTITKAQNARFRDGWWFGHPGYGMPVRDGMPGGWPGP